MILSNPEQSKHLETARLKLAGLEIDLVNLRSESYADSRIPTMDIGTPEEDAMRRAPAACHHGRACGPQRVTQGAGAALVNMRCSRARGPGGRCAGLLARKGRASRALPRLGARRRVSMQAHAGLPGSVSACRAAPGELVVGGSGRSADTPGHDSSTLQMR